MGGKYIIKFAHLAAAGRELLPALALPSAVRWRLNESPSDESEASHKPFPEEWIAEPVFAMVLIYEPQSDKTVYRSLDRART